MTGMISIKIDEIQEGKKKEKMKRIFASYFVMFLCFLLLGLVAVQPSHAGADLFPMPIPNNKTVLVENNREAVSHIYNYRQLMEWCEMERSLDLASQLWELSFYKQLRRGIDRGLQPQYSASPFITDDVKIASLPGLFMDGHEKSTASRPAGMEVFVGVPGMARFPRMASSSDHSIQPGTYLPQWSATTCKPGKPPVFMRGCPGNSLVGRIHQKGSIWNKQTIRHFFNR